MTAAENKALTPRDNRAFRFFTAGTEFFPGVGTRLHFGSQAIDTLNLVNLPAELLTAGDTVTVTYLGTTIFVGDVEQIIDRHGGGTERTQDVTCQGPFGKMQRLLFRQTWGTGSSGSHSSHVILNQTASGAGCSHQSQLSEIAAYGQTKCGYQLGTIQGHGIHLPFDETRDITVAAALRRQLRFFPKSILRFDYSTSDANDNPKPTLHVREPNTATDAAYLAAIPKTARSYEYNAHPIQGVYLYAETFDGSGVVAETQRYPLTASPDDLDVVCAYIPLARAMGSVSTEYFEAKGEEIGEDYKEVWWWWFRHPRLTAEDANTITLSDVTRGGTLNLPYLAEHSSEELAAAGCRSEVVRFTCKATINRGTDIEENVVLSMDFLTTDAIPGKKYLLASESSFESGETMPTGLAQAIFEQRSGALKNEYITLRLGDALPTLGDCCDGLILQEFDVDCASLTANLHFGQPEYLSIDDMRGLLSGFRQRSWAKSSYVRKRAALPDDEEDENAYTRFIQPLSSTEFCPGKKIKTEIGDATDGGAVMQLDPSLLPAGAVMKPHTLTIEDESGSGSTRSGGQQMMILATGDVVIPRGGSAEVPDVHDSTITIQLNGTTVGSFTLNQSSGKTINITGVAGNTQRTFTFNGTAAASKFYGTGNISLTAEQKTLIAGTNITLTPSSDGKSITISATGGTSGYGSNTTRKVVADVRYDATNHVLQKRFYTETWNKGVLLSSVLDSGWTTIAQAVEETV